MGERTHAYQEVEERPQKSQLVMIGGGSGTSNTIGKLGPNFQEKISLSAICTTVDSGRSTGELQKRFLHPSQAASLGDIRQLFYSLMPHDVDPAIRAMWNYRNVAVNGEESWNNHPLGNIIIAYAIQMKGDVAKGIEWLAETMRLRGKVFPMTLEASQLWVETASGERLIGEHVIDSLWTQDPRNRVTSIGLTERVALYEKAEQAIEQAKATILGPGSQHTSLMPNLLVAGMSDAIKRAQDNKGEFVWVANIFAEMGHGEPYDASVSMRLKDIVKCGIYPNKVIVNTGKLPESLLAAYEQEGKYPVHFDREDEAQCKKLVPGLEIITGNYIEVTEDHRFRHNDRIADDVFQILGVKAV